jgi:hypothetical protein
MNYRYTQKDIKIIDMSNVNDWMYNWIREKSGKVKVETNSSDTHLDVRGSSDNNPNVTYNTHSKETQYCNIHNIKKDSDNQCNVCIEKRNV